MIGHKKIYTAIINVLEKKPLTHKELVSKTTRQLIKKDNLINLSVGKDTEYKGFIGATINEMLENKLIETDADGKYTLRASKSVALRVERCENAILTLLKTAPHTKADIRLKLELTFGTESTATKKDDNTLYEYIGLVLKRLQKYKLIELTNGKYSLRAESSAKIDDIKEMLSLKDCFLSRLHAKGGEFFEHYFMTLLEKYLSRHGKTVTENYTTGGSNDGGIDGVMCTVDILGFKEIIMVQTKNRLEYTNETTARAFYGAVCAKQGSRGIFATTSDFHYSAGAFFEKLENCVGINGDTIFKMAAECQYGLKKIQGKLVVDGKLL